MAQFAEVKSRPILIFTLVLALLVPALSAAEPLKVMTYNVWYGFDRKKNLDKGVEWIARQDCDVLALQELRGFNQESLAAAAKRWGHPHAVIFDRKGGFPQGLSSKYPIEHVAQIQPEGDPGLRGTLYLQTAGVHFFVVHFDPRNFLRRQKEAAAVAEKATSLIAAGERVIVLGDFNAHSPADRETILGQAELLEKWRLKEQEQKNARFFDEDGRLDFSVIESLLAAGLEDPARAPSPTFPSHILAPEDSPEEHAAKMQRIDFILVDSATANKSAGVDFPREAILDEISDHYPVILNIN